MKEECWIYRNKCLEFPPDGYYGFTYIIKDILNGKRVIRGTKDIAETNFHLCRPALFEYN